MCWVSPALLRTGVAAGITVAQMVSKAEREAVALDVGGAGKFAYSTSCRVSLETVSLL